MNEEKELKYQIKYAVMPIEEWVDWPFGENEEKVVANIVSKCYVISYKKECSSKGTYRNIYEVVFPYVKDNTGSETYFGRYIPNFDIYFKCTNSVFVDHLFDNFEDAKKLADKANEDILHNNIKKLHFKTSIKSIEEKHQETLDRIKKFENYVKKETDDMKVTKTYCLDAAIEKIVENPSEFYIKLANLLSTEEREFLKQLIENKSCKNCNNLSCSVEYCDKVELDEFGNLKGSGCLGWANTELIGRQKILANHQI